MCTIAPVAKNALEWLGEHVVLRKHTFFCHADEHLCSDGNLSMGFGFMKPATFNRTWLRPRASLFVNQLW